MIARYINGVKTPEYIAWLNMKQRCGYAKHPNARNYSERGIQLHPAWTHDFNAFTSHIGPRPSRDHSVERIDNEGNYEPGNVRWATREEQQANTRRTKLVTHNGLTLCCNEWDRRCGFREGTVATRISIGWSVERAIADPVMTRHESAVRAVSARIYQRKAAAL